MKLHWLHTDCLNTSWVDPTAGPAVFIFDDRQLEAECWSLKRIGFVYECLLHLPGVEIWRGPMVESLTSLCHSRQLSGIRTVRTPDPWLQDQAGILKAGNFQIDWVDPEPFVTLAGPLDLRRFSRYWRKAEPGLFS